MERARLDSIRIASPCPAKWEEMAGDDRVRFCGLCKKNVYDLSALTRGEAERLLGEKEGKLCARLFRRADGTVLTRDCPVGFRARVHRAVRRTTAAVAALAGLFVLALDALLLIAGREAPDQSAKPPALGREVQPAPAQKSPPAVLSEKERELLGSLGYVN